MYIKEILSRNRRDLTVVFMCEHCGYEITGHAYDDSYYHEHVVPQKECPRCGRVAASDYKPLEPQHPDWMVL